MANTTHHCFTTWSKNTTPMTCFSTNATYAYKPKKDVFYGVFLEYGNKLRAFKVVSIIYGHYGSITYGLKVAGINEIVYVESCYLYFYKSKEDYVNNVNYCNGMGAIEYNRIQGANVGYDMLERVIANRYPYLNLRSFGGNWMILKWGWRDNEPKADKLSFVVKYDVATDTYELIPCGNRLNFLTDYPYNSREEAIEDNELDVCEFEEDEQKEECYEVKVEVHTTMVVTAKSRDDAEKKANKILNDTKVEYKMMAISAEKECGASIVANLKK